MPHHCSLPEGPLFQDKEVHGHRDRNIEQGRQEFGHACNVDPERGEDIIEDYAAEGVGCVAPEQGLEFVPWGSSGVKDLAAVPVETPQNAQDKRACIVII